MRYNRAMTLAENRLRGTVHRVVRNMLRESEQHILRVQYDKNLSRSRGRDYYYCEDNGRYYTKIDGEWLICTDNYYLEPDCHLEDNVDVVVESKGTVNKNMLREGYQQMMYNDEGEPIGYDYVPDQYEQEEMDWEERMHRHDDPSYAASQEAQEWYQRACAAFEAQGVEVPEDVKYALAREMRAKQREEQYQAEMDNMEPLVDAIQSLGYEAKAYYEPETPAEEGYGYIDVRKNNRSISREELSNLRDALVQNGYDEALIDDYVTSGY